MNSFVWAIVGNKIDLDCDEVEKDRIEAQCKKLQTNLSYLVSARTGHNITKAFNELVVSIHNKRHPCPRKPTICIENTHTSDNQNNQKSCC